MVSILTQPYTSRISNLPPIKPRATEVYLVQSDNHEDWKCDQYPWIHYGSSSVTIDDIMLEKKFYKIRLKGQKESKGRKRPVGSLQFKRSAFYLKDNRNLVLIHYEGDESVHEPVCHGNSNKDNAPEFTRTAPSVLQNIENQLITAMEVYVKTYLTVLWRA